MCVPSSKTLNIATLGASGFLMPDIPGPPTPTKAPPAPEAPNPTAQELGAPKGLKDAQALAARMGTNSLIIPFQSLNTP